MPQVTALSQLGVAGLRQFTSALNKFDAERREADAARARVLEQTGSVGGADGTLC